jgi:hypothetical protein
MIINRAVSPVLNSVYVSIGNIFHQVQFAKLPAKCGKFAKLLRIFGIGNARKVDFQEWFIFVSVLL